jgi:hypothetical protein
MAERKSINNLYIYIYIYIIFYETLIEKILSNRFYFSKEKTLPFAKRSPSFAPPLTVLIHELPLNIYRYSPSSPSLCTISLRRKIVNFLICEYGSKPYACGSVRWLWWRISWFEGYFHLHSLLLLLIFYIYILISNHKFICATQARILYTLSL